MADAGSGIAVAGAGKESTIFFLAAAPHLHVAEVLDRPFELTKYVSLSNDKALLRNTITAPLAEAMGALELKSLFEAPSFYYAHLGLAETTLSADDCYRVQMKCIIYAEMFCTALWLLRDNSASVLTSFLDVAMGSGRTAQFYMQWTGTYWNARGEDQAVTLTHAELEDVHRFFVIIDALTPQSDKDPRTEKAALGGTTSRIQTALYFLPAARQARDLAMKLAYYCICFEALFSVGNVEMTHRIAEATAVFSESHLERRRAVYELMVELYGMRSAVVHGGTLARKQLKRLPEVAEQVDALLRSALAKILKDEGLRTMFNAHDSNKAKAFILDSVLA